MKSPIIQYLLRALDLVVRQVSYVYVPQAAEFSVSDAIFRHDIERVLEILRNLIGNHRKFHVKPPAA